MIRNLIKIIKNSVICKLFNILRCKSDDGALQRAGEISSQQNVLLQYPHPCPQDCYTQSYVVAIPKVFCSNFGYSDPVDRGDPHFWADFQVSYHFGKLLTARSQGFTASKNQSLDQ